MNTSTDNNVNCNRKCYHNDYVCKYCKDNYIVSKNYYSAQRFINNNYVTGYLIKNKAGEIQGILNKDTQFYELAYIKKNTLELCKNE